MAHSRNDPCPCGSGKKYKRCCYLTDVPSKTVTYRIEAIVNSDEVDEVVAQRVYHQLKGGQRVLSICIEGGSVDDPVDLAVARATFEKVAQAHPGNTNTDVRYGGKTLKFTLVLLTQQTSPAQIIELVKPPLRGPAQGMVVIGLNTLTDAEGDAFWAKAIEIERAHGVPAAGQA